MRVVLVGVVLFFLLPVFVSATEYYIDATGGDDSNNGTSPANAWRTMEKARTMMGSYNPGDSILFERGEVWTGANENLPIDQFRITCSGSEEGGYITFGAYGSGNLPRFEEITVNTYASGIKYVKIEYWEVSGSPPGTNNGINVQSQGASHIIVQHCKVSGTSNNGIMFRHTDTFTINNCTVRDTPNSGIVVYGDPTYHASNGIIRNNTIIGGSDCITLHHDSSGYTIGSNHLLENNVGSGCNEQAYDITSGDNITLINNEGFGNGVGSMTISWGVSNVLVDRFYSHDETSVGILVGTSTNVKVIRSIIYNTGSAFAMGHGNTTNFEAYHNTIVYGPNSVNGVDISNVDNVKGAIFNNNIFTSTENHPGRYVRFLQNATPESTNSNFSHNIWWRADGGLTGDNRMWYIDGEGKILLDFDGWQERFPDEQFVNPELVDPENGDSHLQPNSPAIDSGKNVGIFSDYYGNPIPSGSAPDIGAHEYIQGNVYYVSLTGNDNNPGTFSQPFRTVQKGIDSTSSGDTVYIKAGTYDLDGYSKTIDYHLHIIGENRDSTILTNGGTLTFSNSLTVRNLKFVDYPWTAFEPNTSTEEVIDGFVIENCIFDNVYRAVLSGRYNNGTIKNVRISNNEILNTNGSGIGILFGLISDIYVTDNVFRNIINHDSGTGALIIGSNADRPTTRDIVIANNYMDTIIGSTEVIDGSGREVHGILAYGTNISIIGNTVKNLNPGQDHEAIYIKGQDSIIANNVVENCGSGPGGADIGIKGGEASTRNIVTGNRIVGDHPSRPMLLNGDLIVTNNYINKRTGSSSGVSVYGYGRSSIIANNTVITEGPSVYFSNVTNATVADNLLISVERTTKYRDGTTGTQEYGNVECVGTESECSGLLPPYPTCQNMGYLCCNSCISQSYSGYSDDCPGKICCHACGSGVPGDINRDGGVDIFDLIFISPHFGKRYPHPEWNATADAVPSNEIDIFDVVFVASRFT